MSLLNGNYEKVVGFFHQERIRMGQEDGMDKSKMTVLTVGSKKAVESTYIVSQLQ